MALEINNDNFESTIGAKKVALVDFWAEWCGPCKILGPVINDLHDQVGEDYVVAKVNVDENEELTNQFKIRSIPTLIFFVNGEEHSRLTGIQSIDSLKAKLEELNEINESFENEDSEF